MIKPTICTVIVTTLVVAGAVFAEEEKDTKGFESKLVGGLTLTEGNSETLAAHIGLSTKRINGDRKFRAEADFNYGEQTSSTEGKSETTVENVTASVQARKDLRDSFYGYLGGDFLYDDIAAVDYRVSAGPGIGVYLVRNEKNVLDIEGGIVWVFEEVAGVEEDFPALRLGQRYERNLSETARLWQSLVWIPQLDDFDNFTLDVEIGAEADMTDNTNLRVVVKNRYDNQPGIKDDVELDENDLSIVAGVGVDF